MLYFSLTVKPNFMSKKKNHHCIGLVEVSLSLQPQMSKYLRSGTACLMVKSVLEYAVYEKMLFLLFFFFKSLLSDSI